MDNNLDEPLQDCSICLTSLHNSEPIILECNHTFHKECIDEWIITSHKRINSQLQWECPLCRHVTFENQDDIEDSFYIFSIVKFRTKRCYIKMFTVIDAFLSIIAFLSTNDPLFALWVLFAMYGYNGAQNFNIEHLRIYCWSCILPLSFNVYSLVYHIDVFNHGNIHIDTEPSSLVSFCMILFSIISKLYLVHCIYFLSIYIPLYEERIREYFDNY